MATSELEVLGGRRRLGIHDVDELSAAIRKGFPWRAVDALTEHARLSREELAGLMDVSDSTLTRWRRQGAIGSGASDRLARFARLFSQAVDTLESIDSAVAWLREENRVLESKRPLDLMGDDYGAERVREALLKLEYGVYA